jgi:hypothetical protein
MQLSTNNTAFTINQADKTTGTTAANFTLQAQNNTNTASTGGDLILTSGTGTTAAGAVRLQSGGVNKFVVAATGNVTLSDTAAAITIAPVSAGATTFTFASTVTGPQFLHTSTAVAACALMQIKAQSVTGDGYNGGGLTLGSGTALGPTTGTGGDLILGAGTGITANGGIIFANRDVAGNFNPYLTAKLTGILGTGALPNASFSAVFPNTITTVAWSQTVTSVNDGYAMSITAQPTSKNSATGGALNLSAGNSSGTTSTGGAVNISSGTGTTVNGNVVLQSGGTTVLTLGGSGLGLAAGGAISLAGGAVTVTLTATQYKFPYLVFNGTVTGAVIIVFPTTTGGEWIVDLTATTGISPTNTVTLKANGNNWGTSITANTNIYKVVYNGTKLYGNTLTP